METPKHTPGPWNYSSGMVWAGRGEEIAIARAARDDEATSPCERDANAKYIVRACNAHDDLMEALRDLLHQIGHAPEEWFSDECEGFDCDKARAAIDKATQS